MQCNSAMQIFAELKRNGDKSFPNPRSLAEAIVEVNHPVIHPREAPS